jgi:hypothetical protein
LKRHGIYSIAVRKNSDDLKRGEVIAYRTLEREARRELRIRPLLPLVAI